MINKHFFKTLIIFVGMIALGLVGILWVSYLEEKGESNLPTANTLAK